MKIKSAVFAVVFVLLSVVCAYSAEITVAVTANLQYVFEELQDQFQKETGIAIKPVIGSSGKFVTQIENGAPFDVFLSADMDYPQALAKQGLTVNDPRIYAYGTLVLWTMKDIKLDGIEAVIDPTVKKISIASPKTAPYGREALNVLKFYEYYDAVNSKLVTGESIAQATQFITTQAADVGFTAKSIVLAPNMKGQGKWIEVDKKAYQPIAQGAVILKHAKKDNLDAAQKFFDFIFSKDAAPVFEKYGYILP